jgi:adenosine deaminase
LQFHCSALLLLAATLSAQTHTPVSIEQRFSQLRNSPPELYEFLYRMPKGADLHNHVAGAIYAESLIESAAQDSLCVDEHALSIQHPANGVCPNDEIPAARAETDNQLFGSLVDSLSMRNFQPGREAAHDHFFATFNKFQAVPTTGKLLAEVVRRAADQNESYLELMAQASVPAAMLGKRVGFDRNFEITATKLRAAGIDDVVSGLRATLDQIEQERLAVLGCKEAPDSPPCKVVVRYIYQGLREFPKEQMFAQVLAGFMLAASDPRVVAVNLVQPEDGLISMRDYSLHMQMMEYAKRLYPKVRVTLHAGELSLGLVPPEGLRFHIREAIDVGHAERIGHGVDVMFEHDALGLLAQMKRQHIAVEVNLTSNDVILGVSGNDHPFPIYRKYGVPVTLSTDDEGVSRTHLTREYQRAVLSYRLSYAEVKQIVRNGLEYSFLNGASYWKDATFRTPASACAAGPQSANCRSFLAENERAKAQVDLENRFREFEKTF